MGIDDRYVQPSDDTREKREKKLKFFGNIMHGSSGTVWEIDIEDILQNKYGINNITRNCPK
ncbi:hypothetical protein BegalDRAFT_1508 [Beggiatoa alba B18LD]|uniref:Uncharacterized protein n=1 Tax=Beggiatoa alba B18LD TaxID=395493 RepID=I3CFJ9_9GAMM|nr:hypothetical protein [Beggiatoa alba]EIJ42392.1 hypothetical protein BegalDRAFT_1508 [Beggiatoa alba B18LD]